MRALVLALILPLPSQAMTSEERKIQSVIDYVSTTEGVEVHYETAVMRPSALEPLGTIFDILLPGQLDRDVVTFLATTKT